MARFRAGTQVTVSGQVTNEQVGFAAVAGQPVTVNEVIGGTPLPVATGTTSSTGAYSIAFTPPSSGSYTVSTGAISLIENANLSPVYGDILSPASTAAAPISVNAGVSITTATSSAATVNVAGALAPMAPDANATVTLLSRPADSTGAFTAIATVPLAAGQSTYALSGSVPSGGNKTLEVQYADPGSLTAGTSAPATIVVPSTSVKVSFKKLKLTKSKLTIIGALGEAASGTGTTVRLYALDLGQVIKTTTKKTSKGKKAVRLTADAAATGKFKKVATANVKVGSKTYTLKHTFTKGHRYVLQLEFVHTGQRSTYSGYKYITVKK